MTNFDKITVSTQTYIARSNLNNIDLSKLNESLTPSEEILVISYKGMSRGENPKKKKKKKKPVTQEFKANNFSNCVTLDIQVEKDINVKIFNNGVFQLTGCKCYQHAKDSVEIVWRLIEAEGCYTFKTEGGFVKDAFEVYIISAMRNVDFRLGFEVDREELSKHVNDHTNYTVSPMVNGFMGVQITIPIETTHNMIIHRLNIKDGEFTDSEDTYEKFWTDVDPSPEKLQVSRSVTISVFQTGKVLMSGIDYMYEVDCYNWFISLIHAIKDKIMIVKKTKKTFMKKVVIT
jgi:TATA-box binding protein (TBP) (component of TFIID and TFIIIB)